ncbi:base excision DNA repair protein, HhH-GPD family [Ostertagia ostertagi]
MKRSAKIKLTETVVEKKVCSVVERKSCDIEDLWKLQVERITEMRKSGDAPVDTMGCHKLPDPLASAKTFRFQALVALMLSSQTKDEVTSAAMYRLRKHGCNVDAMIEIPTAELEKLLCPVGFYKVLSGSRNSSGSVFRNPSFLRRRQFSSRRRADSTKEKYDSVNVPTHIEDLCSLAGVGPKMAHLVLQIAWNKVEGIAVDTHVHRIVNRLGWMKTSTPEQTRVKLQEMLPRSHWTTINPLLVGFGQQICLPIGPKCGSCLCQDICPSFTVKTEKSVKKKKK